MSFEFPSTLLITVHAPGVIGDEMENSKLKTKNSKLCPVP